MQQIEYQNNRFHGAKQTKERERGLRRYHSAKVIKKVGVRKNIKWLSRKSMCLSIDLSESEQEVFNI